jgi:hypothetical protein
LLVKSQKPSNWRKLKYVAYPFQWGSRCKHLIAASQSDESENWLADQPMAGSLLPLHITEPVSSGKCKKIIKHECEWAFHYYFFALGTL